MGSVLSLHQWNGVFLVAMVGVIGAVTAALLGEILLLVVISSLCLLILWEVVGELVLVKARQNFWVEIVHSVLFRGGCCSQGITK